MQPKQIPILIVPVCSPVPLPPLQRADPPAAATDSPGLEGFAHLSLLEDLLD